MKKFIIWIFIISLSLNVGPNVIKEKELNLIHLLVILMVMGIKIIYSGW